MPPKKTITAGGKGHLLALLAGALFPLGLAPLSWWPLIPVSLALLVLLLEDLPPRAAFHRAWFYGFGMNGVGVSWVYVSIHYFGDTPIWLSVIATTLFVAFLSVVFFALPFWCYRRCNLDRYAWFAFPAVWVLAEWSKTWFLSGFPWLWAGYGFIDTPLAPLAPVLGVLGISFIVALTAVCLRLLLQRRNITRWQPLLALAVLWGGCYALGFIHWTHPNPKKPLKVALLQGEIAQEKKWDPQYQSMILKTYKGMTEKSWGADFILWPEAAYPVFYNQAYDFISDLDIEARDKHAAIASGVPFWQLVKGQSTYYNSIFVIGDGAGFYNKQKLVPFGEYVPLASLIRGLIPFFNLPMSSFTPGAYYQPPLQAKGLLFSAYICYDVVFPELVRREAKGVDFMVTISNDAWFGHSWGPQQHFQMARMRALETGKYLLRGTNTGITGIIDSNGKVVSILPQFERGILRGKIYSTIGKTPYMFWGWWPILGLCGLALISGLALGLRPSNRLEERPLYHN